MKLVSIYRILSIAILSIYGQHLNAMNYYVDCNSGNDKYDGKTVQNAWRSINKINSNRFNHGDAILLKKDCVWYDVSIKVYKSITISSYGESGEKPRLLGVRKEFGWVQLTNNIYTVNIEIEKNTAAPKELRIVVDDNDTLYSEVTRKDLTDERTFHYDINKKILYVKSPLDYDLLGKGLYVASKPHVIEFQDTNFKSITIDGVDIRYANEYGIGFWYQSGGTINDNLIIKNNYFLGNAFQSIHLAGTNSFNNVEITNNIIAENGHEAIYIGYVGAITPPKIPYVIKDVLVISDNEIGGKNYGWRSYGPHSAANGDGIDIKPGVQNSIIKNNIISNIEGYYAIGMLSSNALIENNYIENVHLNGADPGTNISGLYIDPQSQNGKLIVRGNKMDLIKSHGIVIRGHGAMNYSITIEANEIAIEDEHYGHFSFTSQSRKNTNIFDNTLSGGVGMILSKECCRINNINIYHNKFNNVHFVINSVHSLSGMDIMDNIFCQDAPSVVEEKKYSNLKALSRENSSIVKRNIIECVQ